MTMETECLCPRARIIPIRRKDSCWYYLRVASSDETKTGFRVGSSFLFGFESLSQMKRFSAALQKAVKQAERL